MEIKIEIPDYSPDKGLISKWENGFEIETKIDNDAIHNSLENGSIELIIDKK